LFPTIFRHELLRFARLDTGTFPQTAPPSASRCKCPDSTQSRLPPPESQRQQSHGKQTFYYSPVECILTRIGEPSEAPPISPCRGPPEWEMLDRTADFDPIHPDPEYDFDQSVSW